MRGKYLFVLAATAGVCLLVLACLLMLAGCGSTTRKSSSSTAQLVPIGAGLRGPAGLQASVYAQGPATAAAFALDSRGRLWLTAAGLNTHTMDGVYMVAKPGAPAIEVARGMRDPLGLVWHGGELYVASLGHVYAFSGFDRKQFTKRRTVLNGPVRNGENNNLLVAPDGRLIMGVTASCDHCTPASEFSGAIVSFRPDGGDLRVYARRIRAPVGLAYYPGTNSLFVSMNQRDDLGAAATPGDWLAVVREGQDWGFPECYGQGGAACTGVPRPTAVLDPHAAVGGVAIATGQLGRAVGVSALVAEWQSAKVQRVSLLRASSSYRGSVRPFLTGIKNPLALALTPDRSLLLGDWATGTIYRIRVREGPTI
jgi:glucose/arabinose dehydrogenase